MTEILIKTDRLPESVVKEAEDFIGNYRSYYVRLVMLSCIGTVVLPDLYKILGLAALLYLLFLTPTARIIRYSESYWQNQVLGSVLTVAMLFTVWYLDIENIYYQILGQYPDFDAKKEINRVSVVDSNSIQINHSHTIDRFKNTGN